MSTSDNLGLSTNENATKTNSDRKTALVVGINNSNTSSRLETLRYAEEDAYEVYRVLRQDACGFTFIDPVLTGDKAGTGNIRSAIIRLVEERTDQDFLLFYFIGHAQPMKTKDGQSDIYFVTYDFNPNEVKIDPSAHLSMNWLRNVLYQSKGAGKILIILDCCYAGNMIDIKSDSSYIHIEVNVRQIVEQCLGGSPVSYQMGRLRVILTATGYNRPAQERQMTSLLLSTLQGTIWQAADHEGFINIHSLYTYLQAQMPQEQLPNLAGDFPRMCILAYHPQLAEEQRRQLLKAQEEGFKQEITRLSDQLFEVSRIITDPKFFEKQAATNVNTDVQYFDSTISVTASFADLHSEKIIDYFNKDRVRVQDDFLLEASDQDRLRHFGLLQKANPTYGALLCFGRNPTNWLPGASIRCTRWSGDDRLEGWLDAQDYRGDLIKQFETSRDFVRKHLNLTRVITRDERNEELEIPLVALEEALANALVHREYANQTSPTYLNIFDSRIEITSPGVPPEPMTIEILEEEHTSHPRNPQIARLFYLHGYVETAGSGIQRMQRALERSSLPPATFEIGKDRTFKVIFYRPRQLSKEESFETEYRQAVIRNLDVLQHFGADISLASRRHCLSMAYVTLSVRWKCSPISGKNSLSNISQHKIAWDIFAVDTALACSHRLLVRGEAGSGKTTLLQWIAVKAAIQSFEGRLSDWNNYLPFYIRLRQCVHSGLPRPEDFPGFVAPAIAGTMPNGWVHAFLKSGQAIILVDGIDEIPVSQRDDVYTWLKDLVETYPEVRYIVTSRPHAIAEDWMSLEAFSEAALLPMELDGIFSYIARWHEAVRQELQTDEEKSELGSLAEHFKAEVKYNRSLQNLATNPLLCAVLCALHRDRRQSLPTDRIELYEACCQLLMERRDKERRIDLTDYPTLTYRQKRMLLEDLAYWMIQQGWSEAQTAIVDERFTHKLAQMSYVADGVTGSDVRRLLVERSAIIREPEIGHIDFSHRIFQEFLAAQIASDVIDVGQLVVNAHNDQWREVIILAAGLAPKSVSEQLMRGLILRGDREKERRYQLYFLAVSCLETLIELSQELRIEIEKRLRQLIPPKNMTDAKAFAAAGELAVKYLAKKEKYSATATAACIRTLALIGGDAALEILEGYADDTREVVIKELLKSWIFFNRESYVRRILSRNLRNTSHLRFEGLPSLDGLQYLTNVTALDLVNSEQISDLSPLANLRQLTSLNLTGCKQITDLSSLASLTQLTSLNLSHCEGVSDLWPLANLSNIKVLDLSYCTQIGDLSVLSKLSNLELLELRNNSSQDLVPEQIRNQVRILS